MNSETTNLRSLADILSDMKDEIQQFAQTRIDLFRQEVRERTELLKAAIPLAIAGGILLATAFFLFSFALVSLLAAALRENPYRWFLGALIVAVVWGLAGGTLAFLAKRRLTKQTLMPEKTLQVLNGDRVWLKKETKSAA